MKKVKIIFIKNTYIRLERITTISRLDCCYAKGLHIIQNMYVAFSSGGECVDILFALLEGSFLDSAFYIYCVTLFIHFLLCHI